MRKIKFGSMEILGYIGVISWVSVNYLRGVHLSANPMYIFLLGIIPNLGAAWVMTMFGKWFVLFALKKKYTSKIHGLVCLIIFTFGLASEIFHDMFLNSPFDIYDMLITIAAQVFMFYLPAVTKDRYFEGYM